MISFERVCKRLPGQGQQALDDVTLQVAEGEILARSVHPVALLDRIGAAPALVALTRNALLPIVRNTVTGIAAVPPEVREAAQPPLGRPGKGSRGSRTGLPGPLP